MKEGLFNRIVAPATVVIAMMAVVVWVFPRGTATVEVAVQERPGEPVTAVPGATETDHAAPPVESAPAPAIPTLPTSSPPPASKDLLERRPRGDSEEPLRVSLGDGEQAVILNGKASLAVAFTRVGEEAFPSLRVEGDSGPKTLALLGPGGRLEFTAAGRNYVASVLRRDDIAKRLYLQVDLQQ